MKIGIFNQMFHNQGGAAAISHSLKKGFEDAGNKVYFIAHDQGADIQLPQIDSPSSQASYVKSFQESLNDTAECVYERLKLICLRLKLDKLIINNIAGSGLTLEGISKLSLIIPTYVVVHDLSWLSGGCANNSSGCERFLSGCFSCPALNEEPIRKIDHSADIWKFKQDWLKKGKINFITPSKWAYNHYNKALSLTNNKVHLIYNGVDSDTFKFNFKTIARDKLGLPNDRKILLFAAHGGSNSPFMCKKSLEAVEKYFLTEQNTLLISLGNFQEKITDDKIELGYISDKKLLNLYFSAADLFVFPTTAQTAPLVIREVILSGTFFASYAVGGVPELTYNGKFGYVASRGDIQELIYCVEEGLYKTISPKDADVHEFKASTMIENYLKLLS